MAIREIVPINPEYALSRHISDPVIVNHNHAPEDFADIVQVRDTITDEQCGRYRECYARPSEEPGCGVRIVSIAGEALTAECPAGAVRPYTSCAKRVLDAIVNRI